MFEDCHKLGLCNLSYEIAVEKFICCRLHFILLMKRHSCNPRNTRLNATKVFNNECSGELCELFTLTFVRRIVL